jgi:hypothetical protein
MFVLFFNNNTVLVKETLEIKNMYNFNMSAISTSPMVGIDLGSNTPRTPEILNSLIAMSNPFDKFEYSSTTSQMNSLVADSNNLRPSEQDDENKYQTFRCFDTNSQSNTSSSSSSDFESPINNNVSFQLTSPIPSTTPSIQQVILFVVQTFKLLNFFFCIICTNVLKREAINFSYLNNRHARNL